MSTEFRRIVFAFCAASFIAASIHAASSNDECASATVIAPAALPFKDAIDLSGNTHSITFSQGNGDGPDAFWRFTPAVSGNYQIVAFGSDVVLGVFTGTCGSLSEFQTSNLDTLPSHGERMWVFLSAGVTFTIVVQGFDATSGGPVKFTLISPAPVNDTCAQAIDLSSRALPYEQNVPIGAYNNSITLSTGFSGLDAFWKFTPSATGPYQIFVGGTNTVLSVLTGSCGALTEMHTQNLDNADFFGELATVQLQQGVTYTIVGQTLFLQLQDMTMNFRLAPAPPSANNSCAAATVIPSGQLPYTETVDMASNGDTIAPSAGLAGGRDAYWRFTPAQTGTYRLDATGFDTILSVFTGACGSLSEVYSFNNNNLGIEEGETLTPTLTAGTVYTIVISGRGAAHFGKATLKVSLADSEANDTCATARTIDPAVLPFAAEQNMAAHTHSINLTGVGAGTGRDVFYRFTPSAGGLYRLEAADFDMVLAVLTGSCGSLNQIYAQDNDNRLDSGEIVVIALNAGTQYTIVAQTFENVTTAAVMNFTLEAIGASANDQCANAIAVLPQALPFSDTVDTNADAADLSFGPAPTDSPDVFWRFTPSQTGTYRIQATGIDTVVGVFTGSCGALQPVHVQDADNVELFGEQAIVTLSAGTSYTIAVRGATSGDVGRVTLQIIKDQVSDSQARQWERYE